MRLLPALLAAPPAVLCATDIRSVVHAPSVAPAFEKIEITFWLSRTYANRYDPDEVDARVEFEGPSGGTRVIPAFWFEGYNRILVSGNESYTATGVQTWMARIVGREPGTLRYRVVVDDVDGHAVSAWRNVSITLARRPGFVRVDARNARYLAFDDATSYRPVGNNLCWAWTGGGFSMQAWQDALADAGGNWTRYWMSQHSAAQAIEWSPGAYWHGLGRYSQQISARFDDLLEHAEQRGVYVQMCLDSYNGWNFAYYPNWNDNPYNTAKGGMLTRPIDYLTNAEARDYAKKRFRYVAARWAYSTAVLCWEFWNEVDIMGAGGSWSETYYANRAAGAAWHQEMAVWIRGLDPFEHLRTTSFSNDPDPLRFPEIWELPEMDVVESHRYSNSLPSSHVGLIDQMKVYDKPCLLGEWGVASAPSAVGDSTGLGVGNALLPTPHALLSRERFSDPTGRNLHDMIWAAAVEESGAASWWWDNWIAPNNLWPVYTPLARFLEGEDWAPLSLVDAAVVVTSGHVVEVYGVQSRRDAFLWVRDPGGGVVTGLVMAVGRFNDGGRDVEFWDTYSGSVEDQDHLQASDGRLVVAFPTFSKDMAVKIRAVEHGFDGLSLD